MKPNTLFPTRLLAYLATALVLFGVAGCSEDPENPVPPTPAIGVNLDTNIHPYDGQTATDASADKPTSNTDFYWEASEFPNKVEIVYKGNTAEVKNSNPSVNVHVDGAYVTVEALVNNVSGVEIIASGSSEDGQLKIYGAARTLLTLKGLELTSKRGPAINNQNKKRLFVNLTKGTVNKLADAVEYAEDPFYLPGASSITEDRKGCLFSEGHLVFCGQGVLRVRGNYRHGIATDGYMYTRPGVTVVVDDAARNAIHVKGDAKDGYGIQITGGYIYANTSAPGGRAMKCDLTVNVYGGTLSLNTSGDAVYDEETQDLQSAACIKADANVNLVGGTLTLKSTGKGGKGINSNYNVYLSGAKVTVSAVGDKATDDGRDLSSSAKGVKADGICIISGGEAVVYAMDDALSAAEMRVTDGNAWIYSMDKDGIDVTDSFRMTGGLLIASGDGGNSSGIDCPEICLESGTAVVTGGTQTLPKGSQPFVTESLKGLSGDTFIGLSATDGKAPFMAYAVPRDLPTLTFLYSSPTLPEAGSTVYLHTGGTATSSTIWVGYMTAGIKYNGGTSAPLTIR